MTTDDEDTRSIVLQCATCGKLLGTAAPVPVHDLVLCAVCDDPAPGWIECENPGLAGFRLFRRPNMILAALKDLGLVAGKAALGFAGGCLLALVFAGAFATTAALASRPSVSYVVGR